MDINLNLFCIFQIPFFHIVHLCINIYSSVRHFLVFIVGFGIQGHNDALQLETDLKRHGIRAYHSRFLSGQTTPDKYLRMALPFTDSLNDLKIGLKILKKYLT
jgi:hypothetical protein